MRSVKRVSSVVVLLAAMSLVVGCGGGNGDMQPVTGTVTFDGQPIESGRILFRETGGPQRAFSAEITNGKYATETSTGAMRVEVIASRLVPGKFDESNPGEKVPMGEMYIPEKYNSRSELTIDIQPGENTVNFDLVK